MPTVFVIDDSPSSLALVGEMLSSAGYRVQTCSDACTALKALRSQPVDLVITDIYMPGQDGLELIGRVHRDHPDIPLIAMSGMSGPWNMLSTAKLLGARCALLKPFSKQELLDAVAAVLGGGERRG